MTESQKNVEYSSDKEHREVKNDVTAIFGMMKDMFDYKAQGKKVIQMDNLVQRVQAKGFSKQALETTLSQYFNMNVLMYDNMGNIALVE